MEYVEINAHTYEKIAHNDQSLLARLHAIGIVKPEVQQIPKLPIESKHEQFRYIRLMFDDVSRMRRALPNGSWGFPQVSPCSVCGGSGKIVLKDAISSETVSCWSCDGKGVKS